MRFVYFGLLLLAACSASSGTSSSGISAGAASSSSTTTGASSSATGAGSGAGTTGGASAGTTGGAGVSCTLGASIALPACSSSPNATLEVPAGCKPTVDGTYQAGEWTDAACVTIGSDPVYVKYSGSTVYFAWSMTPSCGCTAQMVFNPNGSTTLDGTQFDLGIFDDPFGSDGDANQIDSTNGDWGTPGSVSPGILIRNPPNGPATVTYELAVPFSKLGLTAGKQRSIGFGLYHTDNGQWPAGLTIPDQGSYPSDPTQWGQLTSSANWQ
jgi:hypothetical protein